MDPRGPRGDRDRGGRRARAPQDRWRWERRERYDPLADRPRRPPRTTSRARVQRQPHGHRDGQLHGQQHQLGRRFELHAFVHAIPEPQQPALGPAVEHGHGTERRRRTRRLRTRRPRARTRRRRSIRRPAPTPRQPGRLDGPLNDTDGNVLHARVKPETGATRASCPARSRCSRPGRCVSPDRCRRSARETPRTPCRIPSSTTPPAPRPPGTGDRRGCRRARSASAASRSR